MRFAARPTAGSRYRVRCVRRGHGADRPRRARRARSPAASGRCQAHSAAPAPARNRRRCERPRWSATSPRSRSPARPCDGLSAPARWRGPAPTHRARRTAARFQPKRRGRVRRENSGCGVFPPSPAETPAPNRDRRAAPWRWPPPSAAPAAHRPFCRDSGSRPGRRGPRLLSRAPRRAVWRPARRRASPTSRGCADPRASRSARRVPAPTRDRHRASARETRRTAPPRRRSVPDHREFAARKCPRSRPRSAWRATPSSRTGRGSRRSRRPARPSVCAMRSALARAAIRRGSSTMILSFFTHGSSSSASGTRVVLPAPGGATSTAALWPSSVRASSSSTTSIGRGVSKLRGNCGSYSVLPLSPCGRGWLRCEAIAAG